MPLEFGTKLGTYVIQAAIGTGGMGAVYRAKDTKLGREVAIVDLEDGSEPVPAAKTPFEEDSPHFSRDSAWLAYRSYASGRSEIYVQRVADGTGRVKVSSNGGTTPGWSPINDELYYIAEDTIMALGYRVGGGEFHADTPHALVKLPEGH